MIYDPAAGRDREDPGERPHRGRGAGPGRRPWSRRGCTTREIDRQDRGADPRPGGGALVQGVSGLSRPRPASRSTSRWCTGSRATGCCRRGTSSASTSAPTSNGYHGDGGPDLPGRAGRCRRRSGCCDVTQEALHGGDRGHPAGGAAGGDLPRGPDATRRRTGSRWCGIWSDTGSAASSTRSRRCRTSARRSRARCCGAGMVLAIEPMVNAGRLGGLHPGRTSGRW